MGIIFILAGILYIYKRESNENEGISFFDIEWKRYALDKYQILKSFTFGSVLFLNFYVQWNIYVFFMKFPMPMGPHSLFYIYMGLAVILFFGGVQILIKILREKFLIDNIPNSEKALEKKIIVGLSTGCIGFILYLGIIYISFRPLLDGTLFGNLTFYLAILFGAIYLITSVIKLFCVDKGIFGISVFLPLWLISIIAYMAHI